MMNGVSLFANVGIAETYMDEQGINIVVANELLFDRVKFYKEMYPESDIICGDITDKNIYNEILQKSKIKECDFLIATPPCQGMSIAGKMDKNDSRNSLIKQVVNMILDLKPSNALIENVSGILNTSILINDTPKLVSDYIKESLFDYHINYKVVDCADYGTPQHRKRAIFLISKIAPWEFGKKEEYVTLFDAIGHLPSLESGEQSNIPYHNAKHHNERHILCMQHTKSGKSAIFNKFHYPKKADGTRIKGYSTTYKRMSWHKPCPTITMANGSISSQNNVHAGYEKKDGTYSDARVLTLKEIFILTGLPDDWSPPSWSSDNLIRQVIGEGVPPNLIRALLRTMPKSPTCGVKS